METFIKQRSTVTFSRYSSSVHAERILTRILEVVQPDILYKNSSLSQTNNVFDNRVISLRTNLLLPSGSRNHKFLRVALEEMMSCKIKIKGKDGNGNYDLVTGFILQYKFYEKSQFVSLEISNELLKFLLNARGGYTRYLLDIAFNSRSSYTMRIYKWISHWRDKESGFPIILYIDSIRDILDLKGKYTTSSGVLQRVIKPAQEELKSRGDIWFKIEDTIKRGRKVVGWKISIQKKQESKKHNQALPQTPRTKRFWID